MTFSIAIIDEYFVEVERLQWADLDPELRALIVAKVQGRHRDKARAGLPEAGPDAAPRPAPRPAS